jgi:hypothetical protein
MAASLTEARANPRPALRAFCSASTSEATPELSS